MEQEDDASVLAWGWPKGFSSEDQSAWERLSPKRKREALKRLRALKRVLAPDEGVEPITVTAAAIEAGVSRRTMFNIASEWRQPRNRGRTLAALGFRPRPQSRSLGPDWDFAEKKARALFARRLAKDPGIRSEDLIAAVEDAGVDPLPSRSTLFRWISEEKRSRAVGTVFGARIAIDRVRIEATDEAGRVYYLFAVVDVGSRLVLGWCVCDERDAVDGVYLHEAAADAAARLLVMPFSDLPVSAEPPVVEFVAVGRYSVLLSATRRWGGSSTADPKKFGRRIAAAVGERVGPYRIASGRDLGFVNSRNRKETSFASIAPDALSAVVEKALVAHNQAIFARFPTPPGDALIRARDDLVALLSD